MSGHNKWSKIKRKKGVTDREKSGLYSKHAKAISSAAKHNPNPETNQHLKQIIEQARKDGVPKENIKNALKGAKGVAENTKKIQIEAYGPAGTAILVIAETNNQNRTIQEIKSLLNNFGGKWASPGSVLWNFEKPKDAFNEWRPKFPQEIPENDKKELIKLVEALKDHEDVEGVYASAKI